MKIHIWSFASHIPDWAQIAINDYQKKCPWVIIDKVFKPDSRKKSTTENLVTEKFFLLEQLELFSQKNAGQKLCLIALDEKGKDVTSEKMAKCFENFQNLSLQPCFLIGSSDGLHQDIKSRADELWCLSRLTLPHAMAKLVLMEQIFRCWSILENHPYHRV